MVMQQNTETLCKLKFSTFHDRYYVRSITGYFRLRHHFNIQHLLFIICSLRDAILHVHGGAGRGGGVEQVSFLAYV